MASAFLRLLRATLGTDAASASLPDRRPPGGQVDAPGEPPGVPSAVPTVRGLVDRLRAWHGPGSPRPEIGPDPDRPVPVARPPVDSDFAIATGPNIEKIASLSVAPARPIVEVAEAQPRVLVVAWAGSMRDEIVRLLQRSGRAAVVVEDLGHATALARSRTFERILVGIEVPVVDGLAAAFEIRIREALLGLPRVPILAMGVDPDGEDAARLIEGGFDGVFAGNDAEGAFRATPGSPSVDPADPESHDPPLRVADLEDRCGGDLGVVREVLASFLESTPASIHELRGMADRGDLAGLVARSHGLKGAAATIGAAPFAEACGAAEEAAALGNRDASGRAVRRLVAAWSALLPALRSELGGVEP